MVAWGYNLHEENFAFATLRGAFSRPDVIAFDGTSRVTYQRFADLVVHFARKMREFGVGAGSTVGLSVASPVVAQVAVTAVGLLGARWLQFGALERKSPHLQATHFFTGAGEGGTYQFTRAWLEAPPASVDSLDDFPGHAHPDDVWMIATSSGTTGRQKYMPLGYRSAWRRISGNIDLVDGKPMIFASLFGATGHTGLRPRLGNLLAGGTNVQIASFEKMLARGVNRLMGSPVQIAAHIRKATPPDTRIRSCRLTGAVVTSQFVEWALDYFDEVQVLYGSTETGGATVARFTQDRPFDGSAGHPLDGVELSVVDGADKPVEAGVEGIIRVRTDGMVMGYVGDPELTQAVFRNGWFEPGDLGYIDATGAVHISGRISDVINTGGVKFNAADLDASLQRHPDVEDGYCFIEKTGHGEDVLSATISLKPSADRSGFAAQWPSTVKGLGPARALHRLYVVDTVLRNENGKPMRAESAKAVQSLTPIILS